MLCAIDHKSPCMQDCLYHLQGGRLLSGRCTQGSETVLPDLSKVRRTPGPRRSVRLHKKERPQCCSTENAN